MKQKAKECVMDVIHLTQLLANATKTHIGCNGHHKAMMNELRAKDYAAMITKAGGAIPDRDTLLKIGIFNGEGAY